MDEEIQRGIDSRVKEEEMRKMEKDGDKIGLKVCNVCGGEMEGETCPALVSYLVLLNRQLDPVCACM